ncbi:MAG: hypothetical protein HC819_00590 [Cyclobacteriaceae bacterium]|nr:hypothetical protein [Cyclobacteriaceae bacterium]
MEILTQPNFQSKTGTDFSFDSKSRENYFARLEEALRNLSIYDRKHASLKSISKK